MTTNTPTALTSWAVAFPAPSAFRVIDGSTGLGIADVVAPSARSAARSKEEARSFAYLVSASPEMRAALEVAERLLVEAIEIHVYGDETPAPECQYMAGLAQVRAAIASADGKA